MSLRYLLVILISVMIFSCKNVPEKKVASYHPDKNEMADMNRYVIQKDKERIQSYFERKGLNMKETPTGLWYCVLKEGEGNLIKENERVVYEYDCILLDGTKCYSSKESGPNEIKLGRSELPSGLNEGFKLLKPGSEAIFILPPFLAYGLIGDGKKIPPRSTIVYEIKILK
jgi:FKBP-type peptidyl-prolyl cis-trans isomerase FkpA